MQSPTPTRWWSLMPALLAAAWFAGCSSNVTYESYRPVQNRRVDIAYVNVNADFGRYRRLQPEEMGIFFPTGAAPSDGDLERVRSAFRDAFLAQIQGYELVDKPAPDVLRVKASLIDLRHSGTTELQGIRRDVAAILEPGKLTFMIEMIDSTTDSVLLRAADTEKSPELLQTEVGGPAADDVTEAAEHWAQLFRNFLDTNLRGGQ